MKAKEIFVISSEDGSKIITDKAYVGLRLVPKSMEDVLYGLRLTDHESSFERSSDDFDNIQYFDSFNRAEIVLHSLLTREREPVLETLKIVKFTLNVVTEDVLSVVSEKVQENKRRMEEFEKEVGMIGKEEYFSKNSDFTQFKYVTVQDLYQRWQFDKNKKK